MAIETPTYELENRSTNLKGDNLEIEVEVDFEGELTK
jgi:hypothetical protein